MTEMDTLLVQVRADTGAFARDIATMKSELEGPLAAGMDKAGRMLEASLARFIQSGKFGFEDLKKVALSVMAEIARAAVQAGMASISRAGQGGSGGGGGGGAGGLLTSALQLASVFAGAPGRATGGPVSPGRAYRVGERGPEWFVPTASGRVDTGGAGAGQTRDIRITINVQGGSAAPERMQATSRQIARAVRGAIEQAG